MAAVAPAGAVLRRVARTPVSCWVNVSSRVPHSTDTPRSASAVRSTSSVNTWSMASVNGNRVGISV